MRRPPANSKALSVIFRGWFKPATVRFALLKPMLPFQFPRNGSFHSHFVGGVIHCQCDTTPLRHHHITDVAAERNSHRTEHQRRTLAPAVYRTNSNGLSETRNPDDTSAARDGGRLHGQRPAAQNHSAGKILIRGHALGYVRMKSAIPREQVGGLNSHRIKP